MCYSAAVRADYAAFRRLFPRSRLALKAFFDLYWRRRQQPKPPMRTPRVMDAQFTHPHSPEEREIHALIAEFDASQVSALEQGSIQKTEFKAR